jgi:hypothetical protein
VGHYLAKAYQRWVAYETKEIVSLFELAVAFATESYFGVFERNDRVRVCHTAANLGKDFLLQHDFVRKVEVFSDQNQFANE